MALKAYMAFNNGDLPSQWNERFRSIFRKGIYHCTNLTGSVAASNVAGVDGQLKVDVGPFVAITNDGMVVREDTDTQRLNLAAGMAQRIGLRARYNPNQPPLLEWLVVADDQASLLADQDSIIWFASVTTDARAATQIQIYPQHRMDVIGRSPLRPTALDLNELAQRQGAGDVIEGDIAFVLSILNTSAGGFFRYQNGAWVAVSEASTLVNFDAEHSLVDGKHKAIHAVIPENGQVAMEILQMDAGDSRRWYVDVERPNELFLALNCTYNKNNGLFTFDNTTVGASAAGISFSTEGVTFYQRTKLNSNTPNSWQNGYGSTGVEQWHSQFVFDLKNQEISAGPNDLVLDQLSLGNNLTFTSNASGTTFSHTSGSNKTPHIRTVSNLNPLYIGDSANGNVTVISGGGASGTINTDFVRLRAGSILIDSQNIDAYSGTDALSGGDLYIGCGISAPKSTGNITLGRISKVLTINSGSVALTGSTFTVEGQATFNSTVLVTTLDTTASMAIGNNSTDLYVGNNNGLLRPWIRITNNSIILDTASAYSGGSRAINIGSSSETVLIGNGSKYGQLTINNTGVILDSKIDGTLPVKIGSTYCKEVRIGRSGVTTTFDGPVSSGANNITSTGTIQGGTVKSDAFNYATSQTYRHFLTASEFQIATGGSYANSKFDVNWNGIFDLPHWTNNGFADNTSTILWARIRLPTPCSVTKWGFMACRSWAASPATYVGINIAKFALGFSNTAKPTQTAVYSASTTFPYASDGAPVGDFGGSISNPWTINSNDVLMIQLTYTKEAAGYLNFAGIMFAYALTELADTYQ